MFANLSTKLKIAIICSILGFTAMSVSLWHNVSKTAETNGLGHENQEIFGDSYPNASWTTVNSFNGYVTRVDETKLPDGANGRGQNTTANEGDRISIRDLGYELFPAGTASSSGDTINSIHTFRKRSGENIMIRTYGTVIEYYEEGNDTWETLKTGLTSDKDFDFADFNINADQVSYTYFGNAYDTGMRWNGGHTLTNGAATSTTLMVDSTTGFDASSTLILCGTEAGYGSLTATTFILNSAPPACATDEGIAQYVEERTESPIGNIYLAADNRLFISGIATGTQVVHFSAYGDPTTWYGTLVNDATADDAGFFNLVEGGGGVVAMVQDEGALYFFKKSIIYKATLSDSLYSLQPLKPFDGKGQTVGALNRKSVFTGGNSVFFITPDHQIMSLARVESVDYPQVVPISASIKPTVEDMDFDTSSGVVFREKAFFSAKSDSDLTFNDTILVWNIPNQFWDSPILGFNANDFIVYDDGTSEELYFGDDVSPNIYKVNDEPQDGDFGVTASWRSKQFNFGLPHAQKEIIDMFIEGYISQNTSLTISLLLDEDGYTQSFSTTLAGTESAYIYNSEDYNVFGLSAFGTKRFGSNDDVAGKKKFRIYTGKDMRVSPFYTAQIEFASDGDSQDWEITSFGFKARPYSDETKRSLYKSFK
jgi:hypothetical protein